MGGWAVAQSPIMVTTITLKRLLQRGYESMLDYTTNKYLHNLMNRCTRGPYVSASWRKRRTGEAVYSIVGRRSILIFSLGLV